MRTATASSCTRGRSARRTSSWPPTSASAIRAARSSSARAATRRRSSRSTTGSALTACSPTTPTRPSPCASCCSRSSWRSRPWCSRRRAGPKRAGLLDRVEVAAGEVLERRVGGRLFLFAEGVGDLGQASLLGGGESAVAGDERDVAGVASVGDDDRLADALLADAADEAVVEVEALPGVEAVGDDDLSIAIVGVLVMVVLMWLLGWRLLVRTATP